MIAAQRGRLSDDVRYAAVLDIAETRGSYSVTLDMESVRSAARVGPHAASGLLDAQRQAIEGLARLKLGVTASSHLIIRATTLGRGLGHITSPSHQPATLQIDIPKSNIRLNSDGVCYAAAGEISTSVLGGATVIGGGSALFVTASGFEGMRSHERRRRWGAPQGQVRPAEPRSVGLEREEHVVIEEVAGSGRRATSRVSPSAFSSYQDRPLDHYPGLMLADGARQLAVYAASSWLGADPAYIDCTSEVHDFLAFSELDEPPILTAVVAGEAPQALRIKVTAMQHQEVRALAALTIEHRRAPNAA